MFEDDAEDKTIYKVVVNHEEQYSIWPAERENPAAATAAPLSAEKITAPRAGRRGPPHTLNSAPPPIMPIPPTARIVPSAAGVDTFSTSGVKSTAASSQKKLTAANISRSAAKT